MFLLYIRHFPFSDLDLLTTTLLLLVTPLFQLCGIIASKTLFYHSVERS